MNRKVKLTIIWIIGLLIAAICVWPFSFSGSDMAIVYLLATIATLIWGVAVLD